MPNYTNITVQAQSQPSVTTPGFSSKPVMASSSTGNTTLVVIVTEMQPSPSPPVHAQAQTFGSSGSIAELAALALTLTGFIAVIVALTRR